MTGADSTGNTEQIRFSRTPAFTDAAQLVWEQHDFTVGAGWQPVPLTVDHGDLVADLGPFGLYVAQPGTVRCRVTYPGAGPATITGHSEVFDDAGTTLAAADYSWTVT